MTRQNLIRIVVSLIAVNVLVAVVVVSDRNQISMGSPARPARPTAGPAALPTALGLTSMEREVTKTNRPAAMPTVHTSHGSLPAASGDGNNEGGDRPPLGWLGNIPGFGSIAPDETPADVPVRMSGCTISNPLFKDDHARVRPFVPPQYELGTNGFFGPGVATILAGVLACDAVSVEGGPPTRTLVTLVAVQVTADSNSRDLTDAGWDLYNRSTLNFLPSSSWYLIYAHTDNGTLARRLRQAGLPVVHVPGLAYDNDYNGSSKSDVVDVPRGHEGFTLATSTLIPDSFIHNHDWFFWYDLPKGRTGFLLHLHGMEDSSCGYHISPLLQTANPSCGAKLTAEPNSQLSNFLGAAARETPFAFNHPPSRNPGYIALTGPQPSVCKASSGRQPERTQRVFAEGACR